MTFAGALLLGALSVAWAAPLALHRIAGGRHDALWGAICWLVTLTGVVSTFAIGSVLLLLPGHRHEGPLGELGHDCWTLFGHHVSHRLQALIGAAGIAALIIVLVRFARVSMTSLRSRRRDYGAHADLMSITELSNAGEPGVLWLDHPAPFAYSLRGRPPLVVASTGLRALPYAHQDAVMRHEVAHLRGRHHLLVALTQDLAAALPIVPLFRQAPAAVRQLVELAADAAAASACGRAAVRAALLTVETGPHTGQALSMASRDVPLRLRCLAQAEGTDGRVGRAAARAAAVVASAVTPAAVGLGTFLVALAMACTAP
jgi:hypothetical protein